MVPLKRWNRPILVALAVIVAVFGAFELVERTVFRGADPQVSRYLHMARGVGTSLLVAMVLVLYFVGRAVPSLPLRGDEVPAVEGREGEAVLFRRNRWLVRMRWLIVALLTVVVLLFGFVAGTIAADCRVPLLTATIALGVVNAVFERLVRGRVSPARVLWIQMAGDLVFLSVIVHYTGGIENPLVWFYSLHMVLAGILLERPPAFGIAALACALIVGLTILEGTQILAHHGFPLYSPSNAGHVAQDMRIGGFVALALCLLIVMTMILTISVRDSLRESERDLLRAYKMAAIGRLSAGVAHEINNPLGVASARIKLLLEKADELGIRDRTLSDLGVADRQLDRVSAIVRGMLAYARPISANQQPLDLTRVVRDVVTGVHPKGGLHDVRIEEHLSDGPLMIQGNSSQIAQIVVNLLMNALEAMPGGGVARVSTWQENGSAVLEIADTGVGIPPDVQAKMFEPFFTTKSDQGGTGLGLAIVDGSVAAHHGKIEVDSAPGQGTTFTVRFPASKGGAQ
ncbi:MAG: hypothetical protein HYY16_01900 [Planctomycetes bacterium]|nr:hypothetical protein [Planctomycetota bacterium]